MTDGQRYLDACTPEQRAALVAPSRHLVMLRDFAEQYRRAKPQATMTEILCAYTAPKMARAHD
jgi:hypothetical protein